MRVPTRARRAASPHGLGTRPLFGMPVRDPWRVNYATSKTRGAGRRAAHRSSPPVSVLHRFLADFRAFTSERLHRAFNWIGGEEFAPVSHSSPSLKILSSTVLPQWLHWSASIATHRAPPGIRHRLASGTARFRHSLDAGGACLRAQPGPCPAWVQAPPALQQGCIPPPVGSRPQ